MKEILILILGLIIGGTITVIIMSFFQINKINEIETNYRSLQKRNNKF